MTRALPLDSSLSRVVVLHYSVVKVALIFYSSRAKIPFLLRERGAQKRPPPFCVLEDVAVLFPKCVPKREEMCVVVLSRVSTDDDEKNVSAVYYSVSRRPFVVDLLTNEDTETTAFRSLEEERETTGNVFVRTRKTAVLWEAEASREKKVDKTGSKKKDLKKDPKSYSKSSFNKGKREKKTVKRKKERGQRTKTEEVE
jgi:hypothetical protein